MKRMRFYYEMELEFEQAVRNHYFLIRCLPREDKVQESVASEYQIQPETSVTAVQDSFGNHGFFGFLENPHDLFSVKAWGIVKVDLSKREIGEAHPVFRYPSPYTVPDENLIRLYHDITNNDVQGGSRPAALDLALVLKLMDRLYSKLSYAAGVTDVSTTAGDAFAGGQGVCQDYAHILICLCRQAGIPSRYVAGMMVGEGQTHAWAEVFLDGLWTGVDPTHNRIVDETYISLTKGRDYGDSTVDKGRFTGAGFQRQKICVKVEETT